jgi:hypothetical protein
VRFRHVHVAEYPLFRYPPYDQALAAEIVELYESRGVRLSTRTMRCRMPSRWPWRTACSVAGDCVL